MIKIINFFQYVYDFLKFLVDTLFKIAQIIKAAVLFVVNGFAALPTTIKIFLVLVVVVSVAYKIISLGGAGE